MNYSEMNIIDLHRSRAALESSLDLSSDEASRLLAACDTALLEKIDGLYVVLKNAEADIDHWKQEAKLVAEARRSAESTIGRIKSLLAYLKTAAPKVSNKLIGRNYKFTLSKKKELDVTISSEVSDWDAFERLDYALEETTTTTTVLRSCVGDEQSRTTKTTVKLIPNVQAIRDAYVRHGADCLPSGVRVTQGYSVRTGRVARTDHASAGPLLSEVGPALVEG